jgi:hypothetical protein
LPAFQTDLPEERKRAKAKRGREERVEGRWYHVEAIDEELAAEGLVDLVGLQVLDLLPGERRRRHGGEGCRVVMKSGWGLCEALGAR